MSSLLTVIIPTHNRASLLLQVVDLLLEQAPDIDGHLEIVVVDDGSTEDVETLLSILATKRKQEKMVRYVYQSAKGPAAARNLGIHQAKGDIILFLGDDILPLPHLLQVHYIAHTVEYPNSNYAILGYAELAPELSQTPYVTWWKHWNFRYHLLLNHDVKPDYSFFYTNNLSLKRVFLLQHGLFDEYFSYAAYEDGELGARLINQGLKLLFKPEAEAIHYHKMDLYTSCQRIITRGKAYDMFIEKTDLSGISKKWLVLGSGPWMTPIIIRPLYRFADWLQKRGTISVVYILVLMYGFRIGRGQSCPIPEMS